MNHRDRSPCLYTNYLKPQTSRSLGNVHLFLTIPSRNNKSINPQQTTHTTITMRLLTNLVLLGLGLGGTALAKSVCVCIATRISICQLGIQI